MLKSSLFPKNSLPNYMVKFFTFMASFKVRFLFSNLLMVGGLFLVINQLLRVLKTGGHPWASGEWLINYNGGFVRRGLFGTVLLLITNKPEIILLLVLIFNLLLYVVIWGFFYWALIINKFSWYSILIAASPAGILFISWDKYVFVRKELLGVVCLILLILIKKGSLQNELWIFLTLCLYLLSLLMGEINFFYFPSIVYMIIQLRIKLNNRFILIFFFIALTILYFSMKSHGSDKLAEEVCSRLVEVGLKKELICPGAISALEITLTQAIESNINLATSNLLFIPIILFTIIPFFLLPKIEKIRSTLIISFLSICPLFVIAGDYGRWVFMFYCIVGTQIILHDSLQKKSSQCQIFFTIVYTTIWGFPHTGGNPIKNGWFGAISALINNIF